MCTALSEVILCNGNILLVMWDVMNRNIVAVFFVKVAGLQYHLKSLLTTILFAYFESGLLHWHPYFGGHVPVLLKKM